MAARAFWNLPGRFGIARLLGRDYSLRCVVFHHISAEPSPFTAGIRVAVSPKRFEEAVRFLTAHYAPVSLEDVLTNRDGRGLPDRAVLVTFDDAYASVSEVAAPLCRQYRVPAVFFVNAAFVDNRRLAPDNLICYIAKTRGVDAINSAAQTVKGKEARQVQTLPEVFGDFLPSLTLSEREVFLDALRRDAGVDGLQLAKDSRLYLTGRQLQELAGFGIEIGNHTYTHAHCRLLTKTEIALEVDRNKAELEALSGSKIRSFSQPYGSSKDLTLDMLDHLERTGHQAAFLSESVANPRRPDLYHLDRMSTCAEGDDHLFFELEVLPRLRATRNRFFPGSASHRPGRCRSSAVPREGAEPDGFVRG